MLNKVRHCTGILCLLFCSFALQASQFLVEKQVFVTDEFTTYGGKTIKDVRLGWESYGKLNATKSNAILITHYFTGNSHAAGKYKASDQTAGYWDTIIGPGKAIDTSQYFVFSMDTLANVAPYNENVITTGPASKDPSTGKAYGLSFPVVTIRDFVNLQKALMDSLGIEKLHAVIGPSMGSFQAIDWAAHYPDKVARMISVIGAARFDAWSTLTLEQWATPIRLDQHWNNGNYYASEKPIQGLIASLMAITQVALHPDYINNLDIDHSVINRPSLDNILNKPPVANWLYTRAKSRASQMDANHILYLVRACQLFIAGMQKDLETGLAKVQAKSLFLPSEGDLLLMPNMAVEAHETLLKLGKSSQLSKISGGMGHLDGLTDIESKATLIQSFLAN